MKQLLRTYYWWPQVGQELGTFIKRCQETHHQSPRIHFKSWRTAEIPFERVHFDIFFSTENRNSYYTSTVIQNI